MNIHLEPLDILFRQIKPEELYQDMIRSTKTEFLLHQEREFITFSDEKTNHIGKNVFSDRAHLLHQHYNQEEIELICSLTENIISKEGDDLHNSKDEAERMNSKPVYSLFHLLTAFTKDKLKYDEKKDMPVCEEEFFLEWRRIAFQLGEDILTMAYLARCQFENDHKEYVRKIKEDFGWPQNISCDSMIVQEIVEQGLAENHMHLGVSAPIFHLSWLSLMNHPDEIDIFFKENAKVKQLFKTNLSKGIQKNAEDSLWSWEERLKLASWLRMKLFEVIHAGMEEPTLESMVEVMNPASLEHYRWTGNVSLLRYQYGRVTDCSDGGTAVLDYAFYDDGKKKNTSCRSGDRKDGCYRSFIGERYLLYKCFGEILNGKWKKTTCDMFYLYLLLKTAFRSEIIQVNQQVGFTNFAQYQGRKNIFYMNHTEYWMEGIRMVVNGNLYGVAGNAKGPVSSLEARFTPAMTEADIVKDIILNDREILFHKKQMMLAKPASIYPDSHIDYYTIVDQGGELDCFYVLHFPKRKMISDKSAEFSDTIPMRNARVRNESRIQAFALAEALMHTPTLYKRIRAIDACSLEIGCRPETFATEFRFLRNFISPYSYREKLVFFPKVSHSLTHATYHVGEDFLDIVDGLRAIDEAILFLKLGKGDRLGHAIALGIDPELHYSRKYNRIITTRQDRLDDLVWMMSKLSADLHKSLRAKLQKEAMKLFEEIYGDELSDKSFNAGEYLYFWTMRGNHPDLCKQSDKELYFGDSLRGKYEESKKFIELPYDEGEKKRINELLFAYHFSSTVRKRGMKSYMINNVSDEYINAVKYIQNNMMDTISKKKISIEANLTSNLLISTINEYEEHPIFRFFPPESNNANVRVSINTDDPAVFDTSLENEYAILAATLKKKGNDNRKIQKYLRQIKHMGDEQIFDS